MSADSTVTKFPQIDHDQARGPLSDTYEDIHSTLRVPWVAFAIRVMSTFPGFVPDAWQAAKPNMSTIQAERSADEIRSSSILPGTKPPDSRARLLEKGWGEEKISSLNRILDALNYGNPKYLLLITAWEQAFHGRAAGGRAALPPALAKSITRGLPDGVTKLHLVDHDEASEEVRELWRREIDMHLHHGPASDYRVLTLDLPGFGPQAREVGEVDPAAGVLCALDAAKKGGSSDFLAFGCGRLIFGAGLAEAISSLAADSYSARKRLARDSSFSVAVRPRVRRYSR